MGGRPYREGVLSKKIRGSCAQSELLAFLCILLARLDTYKLGPPDQVGHSLDPDSNMATTLSAQLARIAAQSKSTLDVKARKAAHSKSLIFEPRVAATQSFQTIYTLCHEGFEELCQIDARLSRFSSTLFSEESQDEDRTQMTAAENAELDKHIEAFLQLSASRLRLMPAIKAIEWLIRRFRYVELSKKSLRC